MANRFTRWAPTQYVPLPIDYYQSALAYKEQKTGAALEKIDAILAGYGSIDPLSADPQALYDETTKKLRADVEAASKLNLDTPAAERAIKKIINDPTTVSNYDKIMMDTMMGTQARKDLNEYLKKNPKVNAAKYLSKFAALDTEEGKSANFNPNRFRNMPVLSDYYDINKRIEEGIARLHADTDAYKRIAEPYMLEGKETALTRQKVREYVINQIETDPQVKEQMQRNLEYSGYMADPYDIDRGINKMGAAYAQQYGTLKTGLEQGLKNLYGNRTPEQIKALKGAKTQEGIDFRSAEQMILSGIEGIKPYMKRNSDPNAPAEFLDPYDLAAKVESDQLKFGFDQFAWHDSFKGQSYSPKYLAELRARLSYDVQSRLAREKMKQVFDLLKPYSVSYDGRETAPISANDYGDYLHENVKELSDVQLDSNGMFSFENYKKDLIEVRKGEFYLPKDVDVTAESGKGFTSGGGGATPTLKYHLKPGAKPVDKNTGAKMLFEAGKKQIKQYIDDNMVGSTFNLDDPASLKTAIQSIVTYNQGIESMYGPIFHNLSSDQPTRKARVRANLNNTPIYALNSKRKLVRLADDDPLKDEIRKELDNKNSSLGTKPVSKIGKAFEVLSVGNKNYYIEATPISQSFAAPANTMIQNMMSPGEAVRPIGDDMFIKFMGSKGELQTLMMNKGATAQAQSDLGNKYEQNINKIMTEGGVNRETAERAMRTQAQSHGGAVNIKVGQPGKEKYVPIDVPIMKHKTKDAKDLYYAWGSVGNYGVINGREALMGTMERLMSLSNPEAAYDFSPLLRALTQEGQVTTNIPIVDPNDE